MVTEINGATLSIVMVVLHLHIHKKRGKELKVWIEANNLCYTPKNTNSSKRSTRNIDLTFTNMGEVKEETLNVGTSDHLPSIVTCEHLVSDKTNLFPHVHWKMFEALLALLQEFWIQEQNNGMEADEWYENYVRFLAALKRRLTQWKEREKFRPALPAYVLYKLKEVKTVRNQYYRQKKTGIEKEESRILLRVLTREAKIEVAKYKSDKWQEFLANIQQKHDDKERVFWSHLSRVYKRKVPPLSKLNDGRNVLRKETEISEELYRYYSDQLNSDESTITDQNETQIEAEYQKLLEKTSTTNQKIERTSTFEIKRYITKLKPKTSSGFDMVSNLMIKKLPPSYVSCLANCFNTWIEDQRFPDVWKIAKIVTLNKLKSGVPRCEQTRPISLLATHSKLFEKVILERVRHWTETNKLIPEEQSGFRPGCRLPTRVLSMYQEVKNNMAGNIPTLAIYVDYQKAYDKVWHRGLIVKLSRLGMQLGLLKFIISWLRNRRAYIAVGESKSRIFNTNIGLPQGSSLSPYLFIVYHCDLVACLGAHSSHIFADDLSVLITPPINRKFKPMIDYLEEEGTRICSNISEYSAKWKQPINLSKTVIQIFHTQVRRPSVNVYMNKQKLEVVKKFKYLGFTWTDKMSLKPTVNDAIEKIQRTFAELKWMRGGKALSLEVLRKCFFAYSFPYFSWIFPLFPFLPKTQKEVLRRKFRNGLRLIHRCPFASATTLLQITKEAPLDEYVKRFIRKRLKHIERTDLGRSSFYGDIFYWDTFQKRNRDQLGHFFRLKRVKLLKDRHRSLLLDWLNFATV